MSDGRTLAVILIPAGVSAEPVFDAIAKLTGRALWLVDNIEATNAYLEDDVAKIFVKITIKPEPVVDAV